MCINRDLVNINIAIRNSMCYKLRINYLVPSGPVSGKAKSYPSPPMMINLALGVVRFVRLK